jgi:hypothetical protein
MRWVLFLVATRLWPQPASSVTDQARASLAKQRAAAAAQRESVRRQIERLDIWLPIGGDHPAPPGDIAEVACEPVPELAVAPLGLSPIRETWDYLTTILQKLTGSGAFSAPARADPDP